MVTGPGLGLVLGRPGSVTRFGDLLGSLPTSLDQSLGLTLVPSLTVLTGQVRELGIELAPIGLQVLRDLVQVDLFSPDRLPLVPELGSVGLSNPKRGGSLVDRPSVFSAGGPLCRSGGDSALRPVAGGGERIAQVAALPGEGNEERFEPGRFLPPAAEMSLSVKTSATS